VIKFPHFSQNAPARNLKQGKRTGLLCLVPTLIAVRAVTKASLPIRSVEHFSSQCFAPRIKRFLVTLAQAHGIESPGFSR
jgi:hypothetical protein